jgi:hypothetical protein
MFYALNFKDIKQKNPINQKLIYGIFCFTKFHILYDSLNPYEKVFAEDLRGDNIYKHRFPYGMSHGDGCKQIFKILTEYNLLQKFIA